MDHENAPRPHHLNIAVARADVDGTADFYSTILGLAPVELPRDEGAYSAGIHTMQDPAGYQYHFVPEEPGFAAEHELPVNPLVGHLAFRVDDIVALRERLDVEVRCGLLDPSPFSIAEARSVLRPPFSPAEELATPVQALDSMGESDIAWATHALYAVSTHDDDTGIEQP